MFCTTSETEGEVVTVRHVYDTLQVIHIQGGSFVVVLCRVSVTFHLMYVDISFSLVLVC